MGSVETLPSSSKETSGPPGAGGSVEGSEVGSEAMGGPDGFSDSSEEAGAEEEVVLCAEEEGSWMEELLPVELLSGSQELKSPSEDSILLSWEGSVLSTEASGTEDSGTEETAESGTAVKRPVPSTVLKDDPATRLTPKSTMITAINCSQI